MCSPATLNILLNEMGVQLKNLFGSRLEQVVLYGSYARGDFDEESDIDIMALVDMDKTELSKYRRTVSNMTSDMDLKYDVLLSVKLQDKPTFEKYRQALPYFQNVMWEGVQIHV